MILDRNQINLLSAGHVKQETSMRGNSLPVVGYSINILKRTFLKKIFLTIKKILLLIHTIT